MLEILKKIQTTIKGSKFENKTYVAGGFVRDMVLGISNKDIDICVESLNGGVELCRFLSKELNGTNIVIFERFGTAQTVIDNIELEFVMTRKETYSDENGRDPEVVFGTIYDDVFRRDFTINSLLLNITTEEIVDLTGRGLEDLKNGIIRTTSDPNIIFDEDPLRILRAIRFASHFKFTIEEETFKCIKKFASKLSMLSKERVQDEFMKILSTKVSTIFAIPHLVELGLIEHIGLPELTKTIGMEQNAFHSRDVFDHIIDVVRNAKPTSLHHLAALLHDIGKVNVQTVDENRTIHFYEHEKESKKITERFMKELKFSNDDTELVSCAVENHMRITSDISKKKLRKIRFELGDEKFLFLLDLCEADRLSHVDADISHINVAREVQTLEPRITASTLPINGDDVMMLFQLKPSKQVGILLDKVKELVFETPTITKEEVIEELKTFYESID